MHSPIAVTHEKQPNKTKMSTLIITFIYLVIPCYVFCSLSDHIDPGNIVLFQEVFLSGVLCSIDIHL